MPSEIDQSDAISAYVYSGRDLHVGQLSRALSFTHLDHEISSLD